jgi:hypothetical protein
LEPFWSFGLVNGEFRSNDVDKNHLVLPDRS